MTMKKCDFCKNTVPKGGQCNECGFVDGLNRLPTESEFKQARKTNEEHGYAQYSNIDSLLLGE